MACALLAVAAVLATPALASADDCPNAALRTGAQAAMPDCRAWEQVSPVDKGGSNVQQAGIQIGSTLGDRLLFNTTGAVGEAQSVPLVGTYLSSRGPADWVTRGTDGPLTAAPTTLNQPTIGFSDDNSKVVMVSRNALADGATEGGSNIYLRDLTQPAAYTLIATTATGDMYREFASGVNRQAGFVAGTPDLSVVAISSASQLTDDAPAAGRKLYLWRSGTLELASRLPDGTPVTDYVHVASTRSVRTNPLSEDGTRVTFQTGRSGSAATYSYEAGVGSTLISRSHRSGADPTVPIRGGDAPGFNSADGSQVTFVQSSPLTDESDASSPQSGSIYRWTDDDTMVDLTHPFVPNGTPANLAVQDVSPDGNHVWFTSGRPLGAPGAGEGDGTRLFVLDLSDGAPGTLRFVARLALPGSNAPPLVLRFSPDGRRVAIRSFVPLTGADNRDAVACASPSSADPAGVCAEVFTWSLDDADGAVTCLSCPPDGTAPLGSAEIGLNPVPVGGRAGRPILDDGRVFFDSPNRLLPTDVNTVADVYQFTPGRGLALVTSGTAADRATFGDTSPTGADVFFATAERLVEQDVDSLVDIYTARVGGGIATQRIAPPAPGAGCTGADCRPQPGPVPAPPVAGSATFAGPETFVQPRIVLQRPTARQLRTAARRGRLALTVRVNAPGTVTARLQGRLGGRVIRTIGRASGRATGAQTVRLNLRLSARARAFLRRTGRISPRLTLTYSEQSSPLRTTLRLTTGRTATNRSGGAR